MIRISALKIKLMEPHSIDWAVIESTIDVLTKICPEESIEVLELVEKRVSAAIDLGKAGTGVTAERIQQKLATSIKRIRGK